MEITSAGVRLTDITPIAAHAGQEVQ
jgi:hypothetical protein